MTFGPVKADFYIEQEGQNVIVEMAATMRAVAVKHLLETISDPQRFDSPRAYLRAVTIAAEAAGAEIDVPEAWCHA